MKREQFSQKKRGLNCLRQKRVWLLQKVKETKMEHTEKRVQNCMCPQPQQLNLTLNRGERALYYLVTLKIRKTDWGEASVLTSRPTNKQTKVCQGTRQGEHTVGQ